MACDELIALTIAHEYTPRWLSLEGGGDERLRLPIIAVLAHSDAGWALLDTGISPALREPALGEAIYRGRGPDIPGVGHPLVAAMDAAGVAVGDIAIAAVSHLHVDHSGGLPLLAGGPPVVVQARELAFARSPAAPGAAYLVEDYADPEIAWRIIDGDDAIAPGIDAVFTPGHTPGHMSYRVRMRDGATWLFAMDAIDLQEGIESDTPIGYSADPADAPLRRASHDLLVALAAAEGARLVPGHCPVTWPPVGLRSAAA
jgi:glyoxylase-like metal-dependent hydrolase (beta-lactamase superfamily II)